MEFSDKLKQLRKKEGITQKNLANQIFISRSVIAKYENGFSMPTKENAEKLANYFGVKLNYLIDENEQINLDLTELKIRKAISFIMTLLGLLLNSFFIIICFIPIFFKHPFNSNNSTSTSTSFSNGNQNSIISLTLNNNNPIGVITFILCIIDLIMCITFLVNIKNKEKSLIFEFISIFILLLNVFLIILTFMFSISYAL